MTESTFLSPVGSQQCFSQGGSYYLPKAHLKVQVDEAQFLDEKDAAIQKSPVYILSSVGVVREADRSQLYCLDYIGSATANDTYLVSKTDKNLLKGISSKAEDRSVKIAENLINTIFTGLSGNPNYDPNLGTVRGASIRPRLEKPFAASFDPFDANQTDITNDGLRKYGFCIVSDAERNGLSEFDSIDSYCDHPLGRGSREASLHRTALSLSDAEVPVIGGPRGWQPEVQRLDRRVPDPIVEVREDRSMEPPTVQHVAQGIFYRPRVAHSIHLFVKPDLSRRGGWELRRTSTVMLENNSPIIAVGVDRTFFANRETVLEFEDGTLQDVKITKGSELLGFVNIPLLVAQSVVALPANILQVRINQTNNRAQLIEAQEKLLAAQKALNEERLKQGGPDSGATEESEKLAGQFGKGRFGDDGLSSQDKPESKPEIGQAQSPCIADCEARGQTAEACQEFCPPEN